MSTTTQYNPQVELNAKLLTAGASKTVYALVTPETEEVKADVFGNDGSYIREEYLDQFREAWTGKQDAYHEEFFAEWVKWSSPVVDFDRDNFPFYYPTAGASEPLRQIIFDFAAHGGKTIHVFEGEYEGYKAMAEAAGLRVKEVVRDEWASLDNCMLDDGDLFFISQPSAIDGNVWQDFNLFVSAMGDNKVVADVTYVGAIPRWAVRENKFNLNAPSIRNVVFSLSKPFGTYYDRIGGVFCREQDLGLFGNKWFKSLTALRIGTKLMQKYNVFAYPERYTSMQITMCRNVHKELGIKLIPSHVYILATGTTDTQDRDEPLQKYLTRAGKLRVCLTPGMSAMIRSGQ